MKIQCGLYHFDHRPASPNDSAGLLGGMVKPPTEITGTLINGSVVMIYRGNRITEEETAEVQPFRVGPYSLTWDGRLDNREQIARRAGLTNIRVLSDPMIVLHAYRALGEGVLADLVGEFAFTIWCKRTRTLKFARSTCGARTLYYVLDNGTLTWSSSFAHLVRVTDVDLEVNDTFAIQYLVSQPAAGLSPLANIRVIPPNRVIGFANGQFTHSRELWNPSRFVGVRHGSDREYEEHFCEVLKEAVSVRLRANRPVFSELSGGLDSSTVTLMADDILRQHNRPPGDLQTTSCVYEISQTCDERRFIQTVEERRGIDTHFVHERDQRITLGLEDPEFTGLPNALHCFPGRYQTVAEQMKTYGARVLLTGRGGDHLFWSEPDGAPLVADEIRSGHLLKAHQECRIWSQAMSAPYYEVLLKRALPLTLESRSLSSFTYKAPSLPDWLDPRFEKEVLSITPQFDGCTNWQAAPSRRAQIAFIEHMLRYLGSGFLQEYSDMYVSHPYSHRPLIEFCLGTPLSQFLRHGETRSLMRRALRDHLPHKTAKRVSKGLLDETITRCIRKQWTAVSDTSKWQVCERGYVVSEFMRHALNRVRFGTFDLIGSLIRIFSFERWLRSLEFARCEKTPASRDQQFATR
jgi:asparagine synthase (glutamine-hydrolysing)